MPARRFSSLIVSRVSVKLARALAVPTTLACLLLAGCSSDDEPDASSTSSADASSDASDTDGKSVTVDGLTFEAPEGYREVDPDDVAGGQDDNDVLSDLADNMGVSTDQFLQLMRSVDLYLFDEDGAKNGFVDNINVLTQPGAVATDDQIQASFDQLGAHVEEITHETTDAGDVAQVDYTLDVQGATVAGRGMLVATDDGVVNITVSTSDPDTSDEIADRIIDTLAKAS
jgi:hypothetical protein